MERNPESRLLGREFDGHKETALNETSPEVNTRIKTELEDIQESSVILTPETTPVKSRDGGPCKCEVDESLLWSAAEDLHAGMTRSHSDTQLESPRPTQAKVTRSDKDTQATKKSPQAKKGRGRRKGRKTENNTKTKTPAATTTSRRSKSVPGNEKNHLLTEYFPVRRSVRMTANQLKKKEQLDLEEAILNKKEEGLKIVDIEGKGRGVVASKQFMRGDFVVEYAGDLIDVATAKQREQQYSCDLNIGCYMYYFCCNNKNYCVDATAESGRLGRLINHSRKGNCCTKTITIGDRPYLILVASRDIQEGEELLYDYGDRNKESLQSHPWLSL